MIIENVAVLNEAACPGPDHVHMLRLVGIESGLHHVHEPDYNHEREKTHSRHELRRT